MKTKKYGEGSQEMTLCATRFKPRTAAQRAKFKDGPLFAGSLDTTAYTYAHIPPLTPHEFASRAVELLALCGITESPDNLMDMFDA